MRGGDRLDVQRLVNDDGLGLGGDAGRAPGASGLRPRDRGSAGATAPLGDDRACLDTDVLVLPTKGGQ